MHYSDKFSVKGERTEESSPTATNSFCCSDILYIWLENMGVAVGCGTSQVVRLPVHYPSTSSFLKECLEYSLLHLHKLASLHLELVEDVQE